MRHPKARQVFAPLPAEKINEEFQRLQSNSGLVLNQKLFRQLRNDPDAWPAFEKLVERGYSRAALLVSLQHTFSNRLLFWTGWSSWKDKWDGLNSLGKTLQRVQQKMKRHLDRSERGPIPLPTLVATDEASADYQKSQMSDIRLRNIHEYIKNAAGEIEDYCQMRRQWLREVPRKDIAERESIGMFMRSVKGRTGKWYLSDVAKLLKAGGIVIPAETLRKMLNLRAPRLDLWYPGTR